MSMNIKDPAVHALAKEIAAQTGESVTEVVRVALQERKRALHEAAVAGRASRAEIFALLEKIHAIQPVGPLIDHAELLYGEDGLPK